MDTQSLMKVLFERFETALSWTWNWNWNQITAKTNENKHIFGSLLHGRSRKEIQHQQYDDQEELTNFVVEQLREFGIFEQHPKAEKIVKKLQPGKLSRIIHPAAE